MKKVFRSPTIKPGRTAYIERHLDAKDEEDQREHSADRPEFQKDGKLNQPPVTPSNVLYMQKTFGNQAVQRMLKQSSPAVVQRAGLTTEELDKIKQSSSNARNFWQQQTKGGDKNPTPTNKELPKTGEGASQARQFWANMAPSANLKALTTTPEPPSPPKVVENVDLEYWENHNIDEPVEDPGEDKGGETSSQPESNYTTTSSTNSGYGDSRYKRTSSFNPDENQQGGFGLGKGYGSRTNQGPLNINDDISFSDDDNTKLTLLQEDLAEAIIQAEIAGKFLTRAQAGAKTASDAVGRVLVIVEAARAQKKAGKKSQVQTTNDSGSNSNYNKFFSNSSNQPEPSQNYGAYGKKSDPTTTEESPNTGNYTTTNSQYTTNNNSSNNNSNYTTSSENSNDNSNYTTNSKSSNTTINYTTNNNSNYNSNYTTNSKSNYSSNYTVQRNYTSNYTTQGSNYTTQGSNYTTKGSNYTPYKQDNIKNEVEDSGSSAYTTKPNSSPNTGPVKSNNYSNYNSSSVKEDFDKDLSFSDNDSAEDTNLPEVPEIVGDPQFKELDQYVQLALEAANNAANPANDYWDIKDYYKAVQKWAKQASGFVLKAAQNLRKAENKVDEATLKLGKFTVKQQGTKSSNFPDELDVGKKGPVRYGTTKLLEQDIGEEFGEGEGNAGRLNRFEIGVEKQTRYLNKITRKPFQFTVKSGIFLGPDGSPLDSSKVSLAAANGSQGGYIFVMTRRGKFYYADATVEYDKGTAEYKKGKTGERITGFHHSSFKGGGAVAGAGEVQVVGGKLVHLTDASGHYQPTPEFTYQVLLEFKRLGVDISQVKVYYHVGKDQHSALGPEFLADFKGQYKKLRKKTNWLAAGEKYRNEKQEEE